VKHWRLLLLLAAGAFALMVAGAVLLWLALPTLIEREVMRRARAEGVELTFTRLDFGWEWAELDGVKATLIGVDGLTLTSPRLVADLSGATPVRFDWSGLTVEASGSLPSLALALGAWSKRFPTAYSLPLSARDVNASWRPEPGQAAWLELRGGTITSTPGGTIVTAEHASVAGADVGRVGATWAPAASSVALGLGETDLARAPLKVAIDLSTPKPKVAFQLAPTELERLAKPFAVALPIKGAAASASIGLEFASRDAPFPEHGAARATLRGWIPPHPAELDGFVFGDTTEVQSNLAFSPDGKRVTLSESRVAAGKFVLDGGGSIERTKDAATLALDLHGALPCDALASAAAESRVGRLLGRPQGSRAGSVARQAIGGSVGVRVQISANTKNLAAASVKRSIGIGCGLKPLTLADVARLGEELLPSDLSELADDVQKLTPKLPDGTPLIPSGFLPLPPLPTGLFPPLPAPPAPHASAHSK
jgi:hypothetical protein